MKLMSLSYSMTNLVSKSSMTKRKLKKSLRQPNHVLLKIDVFYFILYKSFFFKSLILISKKYANSFANSSNFFFLILKRK